MQNNKSLYHWLSTGILIRKIPTYILGATLLNICTSILAAIIINLFPVSLPQLLNSSDIFWGMPILLTIEAFIEELIFRGPLYIKILQKTPLRLYISITTSCILFGLAHGTILNIFIQGVGGFIFACLFLKGGGMQKKFWRGISTSTAAHALYDNIFWIIFILANGH